MKRYISIFLGTAALLFTSCQSEMDAPMDDRVNLDDVFRSKSMLTWYMNYPYFYMAQYGINAGMTHNQSYLASFCDEAQDSRDEAAGSFANSWYSGIATSNTYPLNNSYIRWSTLFAAVRRCNTIISYLADETYEIPSSQFNEGYRKYYLAQAYIMRAFHNLELIKRYGAIPIITARLEVSHDFSKDKKASFAQCVDFIIADCDRGLEVGSQASPELQWQFGSGSAKREMTAAIAWMVKSEAATYAASPLFTESYAGTQKYTWERALEITTQALDNCLMAGLALVDLKGNNAAATAENIANFFLANPDSDTETIFASYEQNSPQRGLGYRYSAVPLSGSAQESAGACPTQELVDAYEVTNSTMSTSAPVVDLANPYTDTNHTLANITDAARALGYSDNTPYANRDPRFYATIYYNGATIGSNKVESYVGGAHQIDANPSNIRNTRTGYYLRKFFNPKSNRSQNLDGYLRSYRMAHLYLNYVEALYHVAGATGTYTGSMKPIIAPATALEGLNIIRNRVGMPSIAASEVATTEAFELRYRNERRVELAFEGHRFFDVRRWSTYSSNLLEKTDKHLSAMTITATGDGNYTFKRTALDTRLCSDSKYLLYPIPYSEAVKLQSLTGDNWQNTNWD